MYTIIVKNWATDSLLSRFTFEENEISKEDFDKICTGISRLYDESLVKEFEVKLEEGIVVVKLSYVDEDVSLKLIRRLLSQFRTEAPIVKRESFSLVLFGKKIF